ncbi:MAG: SIS domain-containing protein [Desulfobulbaceae bacterium]|nr:SIS domain-containing protein [Candidatus Kapabacteria bacterium]MBS3999210.1 SIS domain-containing protein [Desulfobulbaceae bacterium]
MLNAKSLIATSVAESIATKLKLLAEQSEQIEKSGQLLAGVYEKGGKILFCGNGGSAADCQHIAAELVIRFRSKINRAALPAIALTVDPSMMSAGGNDIGFENVFARLVEAYGKSGDALVAISTSGNSENVIRAVNTAKQQGVLTIGLLGGSGGKLLPLCDHSVVVPSEVTARIQESHILIGHVWCEIIEETIFPELF